MLDRRKRVADRPGCGERSPGPPFPAVSSAGALRDDRSGMAAVPVFLVVGGRAQEHLQRMRFLEGRCPHRPRAWHRCASARTAGSIFRESRGQAARAEAARHVPGPALSKHEHASQQHSRGRDLHGQLCSGLPPQRPPDRPGRDHLTPCRYGSGEPFGSRHCSSSVSGTSKLRDTGPRTDELAGVHAGTGPQADAMGADGCRLCPGHRIACRRRRKGGTAAPAAAGTGTLRMGLPRYVEFRITGRVHAP